MFFRRKKKRKQGSAEYRRHYRRRPGKKHQLAVRLCVEGGTPVPSELIDVSAGGAGLGIPAERDPGLEEEQIVVLTFSSLGHGRTITAAAAVSTVAVHEGSTRYGLAFQDQSALFSQLDAHFLKYFNRRRAVRVQPALDTTLTGVLTFGPGSMDVRIHDLSVDGFGVLLDAENAQLLSGVGELQASFEIPGSTREISWGAHGVHLTQLSQGVLFGAAFAAGQALAPPAERDALLEYTRAREADMARWDTAYD